MTEHRMRWFARIIPCPEAPDGWLPRTAAMRGQWGWDARCSCGQETRTGGAVESNIRQYIWEHRFAAAHDLVPFGGWYPIEVLAARKPTP